MLVPELTQVKAAVVTVHHWSGEMTIRWRSGEDLHRCRFGRKTLGAIDISGVNTWMRTEVRTAGRRLHTHRSERGICGDEEVRVEQ